MFIISTDKMNQQEMKQYNNDDERCVATALAKVSHWLHERLRQINNSPHNQATSLPKSLAKLTKSIKPMCLVSRVPPLSQVLKGLVQIQFLTICGMTGAVSYNYENARLFELQDICDEQWIQQRLSTLLQLREGSERTVQLPHSLRSLLRFLLQNLTLKKSVSADEIVRRLIECGPLVVDPSTGQVTYLNDQARMQQMDEVEESLHEEEQELSQWLQRLEMPLTLSQAVRSLEELIPNSESVGRHLMMLLDHPSLRCQWDNSRDEVFLLFSSYGSASRPHCFTIPVNKFPQAPTQLAPGLTLQAHQDFSSLLLLSKSEALERGIFAFGFEEPSAVQRQAIAPIVQGCDVLFQAPPTTGKSSALAISLLRIIAYEEQKRKAKGEANQRRTGPHVLVLVPTRELAQHMHQVLINIGAYLQQGALSHALVGGQSVARDISLLKREKPSIVIGTPGRLYDMMSRNAIYGPAVKVLAMDEADCFFDHASDTDKVNEICQFLIRGRPQLVLSCTTSNQNMQDWIDRRRRIWGRDRKENWPKWNRISSNEALRPSAPSSIETDGTCPFLHISMRRDEYFFPNIKHFFVNVEREEWKYETLLDLLNNLKEAQTMVFVNCRRKVDWLSDKLSSADLNFQVAGVHSEMVQQERAKVIQEFLRGTVRVLVCNDLLARGFIAIGTTLVFNYDIPQAREGYLHRSSRCGIFGRKGIVINFASSSDLTVIPELEQYFAICIEELPMHISELV